MFLWRYERDNDVKNGLTFLRREFQEKWKSIRFPHFHSCIELTFLIKGQLDITVDDREHTLKPGDMCFIDSFKRHLYLYHANTAAYVVVIHPTLFNEKNNLDNICFAELSHPITNASEVMEFLDFSYGRQDADSLLFKSAFVDILVYLLKRNFEHFPKDYQGKQANSFFDSVIYISDHAKENLHVADVAQKFGYTPNYYSSVFKKNVGISFRDFLNQCRISELHRLRSENPGLSVEKLAEMCGFGSLNTYYRTEKKLEQFNN